MVSDGCHRIKGVMFSDDYKMGYRTVVRLSCKMWACPYCGPRNAVNWRAYLLDRFNKTFGHEEWCFYTITAHKNAHVTPRLSLLNLQQVWGKLYHRLKRRFKNVDLQYLRVFETHASGRFHMHILLNVGHAYDGHEFLIRSKLDEFRHPECKWLRVAVSQLGGGWRCHIRRVWDDSARTANVGLVVGYVLKYISKQMVDMDFPKHQRRIQTSRKIGSPATNASGRGTWIHAREIPLSMVKGAKKPVVDMSTGEVLTELSFEGEHYYPPLRYYRGEE